MGVDSGGISYRNSTFELAWIVFPHGISQRYIARRLFVYNRVRQRQIIEGQQAHAFRSKLAFCNKYCRHPGQRGDLPKFCIVAEFCSNASKPDD